MSFENFHLDPSIMEGVRELGYVTPTPIQLEAIPTVMQGRDLIGLAQTGTGKTAAFVLPLLHRLMHSPRGRVGALVISPTRELAEQTAEAATELGRHTGLRAVSIYGGVSMDLQNRKLRGGAEIIVACPGRLLDHLWKGTITLSNLQVLVIDEADRMFDMGFLPDIHNILKCIMNPRQTLLFSATMPPDIRKLVREVLHNPVTVQIGQTLPAETVSHALYPVSQHLKTSLLKELLRKTDTESVLVFTRTKHRAQRLAEQLKTTGCRTTSLHGDLSQNQRQIAIEGFRNGYYKILVATDIAARGIDIEDISHVINYDMPESTDNYIHRIGRTGRVNKNGTAFSLVTSEDNDQIRALEKLLNTPIKRITLDDFDYTRVPSPKAHPAQQPQRRTSGMTGRRRLQRTQRKPQRIGAE
ncbi:MAG: DEAD/DEAH box helicase [Dehalococcoidales bacterium]|nr:DEAD/DEAH box helicase [Dehalococcoidales bacterium]